MSFPHHSALHDSLSFSSPPPGGATLLLPEGNKKIRVLIADILYVQADHIYTILHLRDHRRHIMRISLRSLSEQLPQGQFIQVHRSYVVNRFAVDSCSRYQLTIGKAIIPISRHRDIDWENIMPDLRGE